ncbi:helix-turn-helix domain-containing protein [Aeribacillus composti]|uniref:helix-turn-helix domain-containing protein n=1 Tax=Aeribacillus composti TaxID=1868734 RepID=UPI0028724C2B|nr:helix-turn-helix transcriptional regulator [Aeribacillus pallidus]
MKEVKRRHIPYTKFKAFLVENNISQSEVAKLLGKSKSALNQNINGTGGDFSLSEIRLICQHYNISADEYFLYPQVSNSKPKVGIECENRKEVLA